MLLVPANSPGMGVEPALTVVPLTGQVANIWKNTQKMVLDGSKIHTQKMVEDMVLGGSKIHTKKMVEKWFWGVRKGTP